MEKRDLPNFPLLFERIEHFLREVHPVGPQQEEDLRMAIEAYDTIVSVIYGGYVAPCNGQPRIKPII